MLEESYNLREGLARANTLPKSIKDAIQRLAAIPAGTQLSLSPSHRCAVIHLIRCSNSTNPDQPIVIRKALLASNIGVSTRTIYRILQSLADQGYITRSEQEISRQAGAQVTEIRWTQAALNCLFAIQNTSALPPSKSSVPAPVEPNESARNLSSQHDKLAHACRLSQFNKRQLSAKQTASDVPEDLAELTAVMGEALIFKLMGIYTRAGKRLGDVIKHRINHILKAKDAYAYTLSLLSSPTIYEPSLKHGQSLVTSSPGTQIGLNSSFDSIVAKLRAMGSIVLSNTTFKFVGSTVEVYVESSRKGSMTIRSFIDKNPTVARELIC